MIYSYQYYYSFILGLVSAVARFRIAGELPSFGSLDRQQGGAFYTWWMDDVDVAV